MRVFSRSRSSSDVRAPDSKAGVGCRQPASQHGIVGLYAMSKPPSRRESNPPASTRRVANLSRRQLLATAGAGAAALVLEQSGLGAQPQPPSGRVVVFTHTTIVN